MLGLITIQYQVARSLAGVEACQETRYEGLGIVRRHGGTHGPHARLVQRTRSPERHRHAQGASTLGILVPSSWRDHDHEPLCPLATHLATPWPDTRRGALHGRAPCPTHRATTGRPRRYARRTSDNARGVSLAHPPAFSQPPPSQASVVRLARMRAVARLGVAGL